MRRQGWPCGGCTRVIVLKLHSRSWCDAPKDTIMQLHFDSACMWEGLDTALLPVSGGVLAVSCFRWQSPAWAWHALTWKVGLG